MERTVPVENPFAVYLSDALLQNAPHTDVVLGHRHGQTDSIDTRSVRSHFHCTVITRCLENVPISAVYNLHIRQLILISFADDVLRFLNNKSKYYTYFAAELFDTRERSIAMSVFFCPHVYLKKPQSDFHQMFCAKCSVDVARSSSLGVSIRYTLSACRWRQSCLQIMAKTGDAKRRILSHSPFGQHRTGRSLMFTIVLFH